MAETVRVHVTHCETKHILSPVKGSEVRELRYLFLQVFSDVLADEVSPADITFQRYDDGFEDYVNLDNDEKINDDLKIRALVAKKDKQVASTVPNYYKKHWCFFPPWVFECRLTTSEATGDGFIRPHSVKENTNYRLWNPVSRQNESLIRRDAANAIVKCNGRFEADSDTVITTSNIARNLVSLIFHDRQEDKKYAMKGRGKGNDVKAIEFSNENELGPKNRFEPLYFWSYTMFRNQHYETLYLGCDSTGKATLVTNSNLDYPNPQALFILNNVVLYGDVDEEKS